MKPYDADRPNKLPYDRPELKIRGSIADLTRQGGKQFGSSDGYWLLTPDQGLTNLS